MPMKPFDQALYLAYAFLLILAACSYRAKAEPLVKYETKPATEDTRTDQIEVYGAIDNADGTSTLQINACGSAIAATAKNKNITNPKLRDTIEKSVNKKIMDCCKDPKLCLGGN